MPKSVVQSLLFNTNRYTKKEAIDWALSHGFVCYKVHTTKAYHRIRQFDPVRGIPKRTITFGKGIRAIVEIY